MPEDQKPFVHQDGTTTPPATPPVAELLSKLSLAGQLHELRVRREYRQRLVELRRLDGDADAERNLSRAIESIQLLQEPRVNMTVCALKALNPSMQALVSDVAIALATNAKNQQHLANALRKLIEGRS